MRFFAFLAGCSEDLTVRTLYRRIVTVEWVDIQLVSYTVKSTSRTNLRAYVVPKRVSPYVENNIPTFVCSGMRGERRWTYAEIFAVMRELVSADAISFSPWLLNAVSWYPQFVPFIPSLWRLDVSAGRRGDRDEALTGSRVTDRRNQ